MHLFGIFHVPFIYFSGRNNNKRGPISLKSESNLFSLNLQIFFSQQFLSMQDWGCCGRAANGPGCCKTEKENSAVSGIKKAVVLTYSLINLFYLIVFLSPAMRMQWNNRHLIRSELFTRLENSGIKPSLTNILLTLEDKL